MVRNPNRPAKHEIGRYERWLKYFEGSVITQEQIKERANQLTRAGKDPGTF